MGKVRTLSRSTADDARQAWRVVDDLALDSAIDAAELDAVEAFLMPLVNAILSGDENSGDKALERAKAPPAVSTDSTPPQISAHEEV